MVDKFFTAASKAISTFKNKYSFLKWGARGSKGEHSGRRGSKGDHSRESGSKGKQGGAIGGDGIDV